MRRAKIVCTLGPATDSYEAMLGLARAGMDVARMNLSHGAYEEHLRRYRWVRQAGDETGRGIGVLVDLQGPKIRLGRFSCGPVNAKVGHELTITTRDVPGTKELVSTTYDGLPGDVSAGDQILVDDGRIALEVLDVNGPDVHTRVTEPGVLSDHKGLNLPGVAVSVPAMTRKDELDLRWAIRTGVDLVALSFVRSPADLAEVHAVMDDEGRRVPVLAKVEKPQAIGHLGGIIDRFAGIIVARGDLGVELPLEQVPLKQKRAIELCRRAAKPVIVATQMLDSMTDSNRPTRAEVSDVANAVLDGTSALMLSGETSVGRHPAHVVATMSRIIEHVEEEALGSLPPLQDQPRGSTARAMTTSAIDVARAVGAKFVVPYTQTGMTARLLARHRSEIPILAFTPTTEVRSQLSVVWGVETYLTSPMAHTDELVEQVNLALTSYGRVRPGDVIVIIAGVPPGIPGTTNGMRVHTVFEPRT